MTITSPNQLGDFLDLIHDRWFDAERVTLDKGKKAVVIHLQEKRAELAEGLCGGEIPFSTEPRM